MLISAIPARLPKAFADSGTKNTIPSASQIGITPGAASLTDGFPPLTFTPLASGGVPPAGADMNGILYEISSAVKWAGAGGMYPYNAAFSTAVGGYPLCAMLQKADGSGFWVSTVDGNTTNPDAGGAGWVEFTPQGGPAFSAYLTANQTVSPVTWTKVPFDTKLFDTNNCFSTSTGRFTPNVAGYYQISGGVLFTGGPINAYASVYKNGVATNYFTSINANSVNPVLTGASLVYLNGTTDYVEIYGNTGGTAITAGGNTTFFQGFLARRA